MRLEVELFPDRVWHAQLIADVTELPEALLGATDEAVALDASKVAGRTSLLAAVTRTMFGQAHGDGLHANVHKDLLARLACHRNWDTLAELEARPGARSVLLVAAGTDHARFEALVSRVAGRRAPLDELAAGADAAFLRRLHKLEPSVPARDLDVHVSSLIASKGV